MTPAIGVLMREVERTWDGFCAAVLEQGDVPAAMDRLAAETFLVNIPAMTGGNDREAVRRYLTEVLVPHVPAGLRRERVSRTVDARRLVDEVRWHFTHDRELPWLLPGVTPTGREVSVLAVSVVSVRQGRISGQRTLWDHHRLLAAVGAAA